MSANEDYLLQAMDAVMGSVNETQEMIEGLMNEQAESVLPARVTVAMECLKILHRSQKIVTFSEMKRGGDSSVSTHDHEPISESVKRYPRTLEPEESQLRDVCCQFLSGYLIEAINGDETD
jgi:hypothetical protein